MSTSPVYARIDTELKENAESILSKLGITPSSAIQMLYSQIVLTNSLPLDPIYTGKAFWGMQEYLKTAGITDSRILFLHTGGTPLFFDYVSKSVSRSSEM